MSEYPFEPAVRELVALLAQGDYRAVEALTSGERVSAGELAAAVSAYGASLVQPPSWADAPLDVVEIHGSVQRSWSVHVPLWSREEGRSDLTVHLTILMLEGGDYQLQVDDLHVL